jgi:hypothetical protein
MKRGKNKELEARANELDKRYIEEMAMREDADANVVLLRKRLQELIEKESLRTVATAEQVEDEEQKEVL